MFSKPIACKCKQGGAALASNCPTNVAVKDYFEVCNRSTREHPNFQNTKNDKMADDKITRPP